MANGKKKKDNTAENSEQVKIPGTKPKFDKDNEHKNKHFTTTTKVREGSPYVSQGLKMAPKKEEPKKSRLSFISKDGWLVIHGAISILLFISVLGFGGIIGALLKRLQIGLFGVVGYVFAFVYGYCAYIILSAEDKKKVKKKVGAIALTLISISSLVFLMVDESLTDTAKLMELYMENSSCGAIGGLFGGLVKNILSRGGGFVVYLALFIFCLIYLSNKSLHETIQSEGFRFFGISERWNRFKESIERRLDDEEEEEDADYGIEVDGSYAGRYEPEYFEESDITANARRSQEQARRAALEQQEAIRRNRKQKVRGVNFGGLDMKPLTNTEAVLHSTKKAQEIAKSHGFAQQEEGDFFGGVSFLRKSGLFGKKTNSHKESPDSGTFANGQKIAPAADTKRSSDKNQDLHGFNTDIPDSIDEYYKAFDEGAAEEPLFDERSITADEDLTKKRGFSTPEESIRSYHAEVYDGSIVKPKRYDETALFDGEEDTLDEETIRKVKEILARRGEIVLTPATSENADTRDKEPEIVIHNPGQSPAGSKQVPGGSITIHRHVEEDDFGRPVSGSHVMHQEESSKDRKVNVEDDFDYEEEILFDGYEDEADPDEGGIVTTGIGQMTAANRPQAANDAASQHRAGDIQMAQPASRVQPISDHAQTANHAQSMGYAQAAGQTHTKDQATVSPTHSIRIRREEIPYMFPPNSLLARNPKPRGGFNDEEFRLTGMKLQQTLKNFGVNVTVTDISIGPVVTRYELQPEQGVKVNKIVNLADDLKLSLAAKDIRIQAPIPGKPAVGIEVPNKESSIVYFRDLIETEEFRSDKNKIAFAIGKDIAGKPIVTDITNMPHLLIAGATGSGKSVCINTIIMSILYKYSPADVKMIMIDPKVVELSVYNGIPHLLIPVVTEAKKAAGALNWAVAEMTDRFKKFAEVNARSIKGYNKKIEEAGKKVSASELPEKMPNIVIIIDELADLMMVAQNEVESSICRIAQLARACGIHLVIATQRPSVNVITGLIKANIPTRIAFAVSSAIDSRTILDVGGAEKLLGKGDMLFNPPGGIEHIRIQGAFISDNEVQEVVEYVKNQGFEAKVDEETVTNIVNTINTFGDGGMDGEEERDELFASVGRYIVKKKKASKGNLQIVFKIGFNRSARIIEQLYQAGVVGDDIGTKPREVLMDEAQFEELLRSLNLS